jgi:hypothetical protein
MLIEVFKTGTHTDSNGIQTTYSLEQINQIVQNYNLFVAKHPNDLAPLVKGHPQSDSPAFGWIKRLVRKNNTIFADIVDIDAELIDDIEKKKFKNFSVALYPSLMLRHIGILGAVPPAVKGLNKNGIVYFQKDAEYNEYNYSNDIITATDTTKDVITTKNNIIENTNAENKHSYTSKNTEDISEIQKLKKINAHLINKLYSIEKETFLTSIHTFANSVCSSPNSPISPSQKNTLIDILEYSYNVDRSNADKNNTNSTDIENYSFAYSENYNELTEKIKNFISSLSNERKELCSPLELKEYSDNNVFDDIEDANVKIDSEKYKLHKKALNYISIHPEISYSDAINKVIQQY